jgi:hypothetical protein
VEVNLASLILLVEEVNIIILLERHVTFLHCFHFCLWSLEAPY